MHRSVFACSAVAVLVSAGSAQDATFDFEDQALVLLPDQVSFTNNGVTIEFNTAPDNELEILTSGSFPPSFGARALFIRPEFNLPPTNTIINFDGGAEGVRFNWGDFGGDQDQITFTSFTGANGTGTQVASDSFTFFGAFPDQVPTYELFSGSGTFGSIVISGLGFAGGPSIYIDNIEVFVPTPGALAAFAAGGLAFTRRRR